MIVRKRINNDIYIRWAIFKPDRSKENLNLVNIKNLFAKAKADGSIYPLNHTISQDNVLDIHFLADQQDDIGIYNLYLEYTKPDPSVEGGIGTYSIDYCDAFELVPVTCMLKDPQEDPVIIEGIIASFSYEMLSEWAKQDIANRINMGEPMVRIRTNSYTFTERNDGTYLPNVVTISATATNTTISKWEVSKNQGGFQLITEGNSPYNELSLLNNVVSLNTQGGTLGDIYEVKVTTTYGNSDSIVISKVKYGTPGTPGTPGAPGTPGQDAYNSTTVFVYWVSDEKPPTPTDNFSPPVGWTTSFPVYEEGMIIWLSTRKVVDGVLVDSWSEPVPITGKDGKPGEDGTKIEFVYKLTSTYVTPETPESVQEDDYEPVDWTDTPTGISEQSQFEWFSVRYKIGDEWTGFTVPVLWSRWGVKGADGDGVEYIFKPTMENIAPEPSSSQQQDDWFDPGWSDDPMGIDPTWRYEWVSIRKKKNGVWGPFSEPALWAMYAEGGLPGEPGISAFTSIVFIRSENVPSTPTGGSWESPIPTSTPQWSDGTPSGEWPLYMSTRVFTTTGAPPQQMVWTNPEPVGDTPDLDFEFSDVELNPGNPTSHPENWHNDPHEDDIWMALRKLKLGQWGPWKVMKIQGEDGKDGKPGKDGSQDQTIYTRTQTNTPPATPETSQIDTHLPTGWTRAYTGVTNLWKHEWISTRQKVDGVWSNYSTPGSFATFSKDGSEGQQGLAGCVVRTSEWAEGVHYRNDEDLITNDTRWIDVVMVRIGDGTFNVYKCINTHGPSTQATKPGGPNSSEYWDLFTNMPPIYTPMIMAPYAVLTFTQTHELVVKNAQGVVTAGLTGKGNIRFWAGGPTPSNANIKIYENGDIEGQNFQFNADGSGHIAGMNIVWDTAGNATFNGKIESNSSGSRIVIDPSERRLKFYRNSQNNPEAIIMGASNEFGRISEAAIQLIDDLDNWVFMDPKTITLQHSSGYGTSHAINRNGLFIGSATRLNGLLFSATDSGGLGNEQRTRIEIPNLPTSKPVSPNVLWNDKGTIKIS